MTQSKQIASFIERLLEEGKLTKPLSPDEVHIFNVHAAYGSYQIVVGPAHKVMGKQKEMQRSLEISGAMHHLFVGKNNIAAHPSIRQVQNNLKGLIIMRELNIHIKDPTGQGKKISPELKATAVAAKKQINLAGPDGERHFKRMQLTGKLAKDTYKIIQEDILTALASRQYTDSST